jgi:hypothetical protein
MPQNGSSKSKTINLHPNLTFDLFFHLLPFSNCVATTLKRFFTPITVKKLIYVWISPYHNHHFQRLLFPDGFLNGKNIFHSDDVQLHLLSLPLYLWQSLFVFIFHRTTTTHHVKTSRALSTYSDLKREEENRNFRDGNEFSLFFHVHKWEKEIS